MASFDSRAPRGALAVPLDLGTLVVTGGDRVKWLNGLVTCDLAPLRVGEGTYGLFISKVGKILADGLFVVTADRVLIGAPRNRIAAVQESLESYLVMEDAETADATETTSWFETHGPDGWDIGRSVAAAMGGWAASIDRTGLGGAAVAVPTWRAEDARAAFAEAGATVGDADDWDTLRLERGVPRFGVDFDPSHYPQEASLERKAVSFKKGCYLGQEVVCRLEMRGHVKRKLVSLVLSPGAAPEPGAAVTTPGGDVIGAVSSAHANAHTAGPIALAMVKFAFSEPGSELLVAGASARVVASPVT